MSPRSALTTSELLAQLVATAVELGRRLAIEESSMALPRPVSDDERPRGRAVTRTRPLAVPPGRGPRRQVDGDLPEESDDA